MPRAGLPWSSTGPENPGMSQKLRVFDSGPNVANVSSVPSGGAKSPTGKVASLHGPAAPEEKVYPRISNTFDTDLRLVSSWFSMFIPTSIPQ